MRRFRRFLPVLAVLVGIAILGTAREAEASFKIRIYEGATLVYEVQDNVVAPLVNVGGGLGTTGDANPITGIINATFTDAFVSVVVTIGQSKPLFGNTASVAAMDVGISGSFGTGGTLTVDITDTNFQPVAAPPYGPSPAGLGILTATIGSSAPAGSTFTGYLNGDDNGLTPFIGNKEYGGIDPIDVGSSLITTPTATSPGTLVTSAVGTAFAPYSMSARTVFSGTALSGFSLDNKLTFASPAPAGLALVLAGMPALGIGAWLRRRRKPSLAA